MTWTQNYFPLGSLYLSALVAAIPVVALLAALAFFHVKAHWAALLGLALAQITAILVFGSPRMMAVATALNDLPIKTINGATIYIRDVAHVRDGFQVQTNKVNADAAVEMMATGSAIMAKPATMANTDTILPATVIGTTSP